MRALGRRAVLKPREEREGVDVVRDTLRWVGRGLCVCVACDVACVMWHVMWNRDVESRCGIEMRNLDVESRCGIEMWLGLLYRVSISNVYAPIHIHMLTYVCVCRMLEC